jgi:hypothetical protein
MQDTILELMAVEEPDSNLSDIEGEVAMDDWPDIVWDYLVVSETELEEKYAQAS